MLYAVQIVMWGIAERPQLFSDRSEAEKAFVQCVRKQWEQRYASYCEHHGLSGDSFASAEAFVASIDASEKSRICFWSYGAEETAFAGAGPAAGVPAEELRQAGEKVEAIRQGLAQLLDEVSTLAVIFPATDTAPAAEDQPKTVPSPSHAPEEKSQIDPQTYMTPEWKTLTASARNLCGGPRNEFHLLPRQDWRQDVYSDRTSFEYCDWVADRIMKCRKTAQEAGYTIVREEGLRGGYRFADSKGAQSEDFYDSELEAWCAAGLHAEQRH